MGAVAPPTMTQKTLSVEAEKLLEIGAEIEALANVAIKAAGSCMTPFSNHLSEQAWALFSLVHPGKQFDDVTEEWLPEAGAFNARSEQLADEWLS
jgi:hypothetical protein